MTRQSLGPFLRGRRIGGLLRERVADGPEPVVVRHRQMQGQGGGAAQLVDEQLHQRGVAAALGVVDRHLHRGDQQLAQQRGDIEHAGLLGQVAELRRVDVGGAHLHQPGHADAVALARDQPQGPIRRHDPEAGGGVHQHHAVDGVQQLRARMAVPARDRAGRVIGLHRHGVAVQVVEVLNLRCALFVLMSQSLQVMSLWRATDEVGLPRLPAAHRRRGGLRALAERPDPGRAAVDLSDAEGEVPAELRTDRLDRAGLPVHGLAAPALGRDVHGQASQALSAAAGHVRDLHRRRAAGFLDLVRDAADRRGGGRRRFGDLPSRGVASRPDGVGRPLRDGAVLLPGGRQHGLGDRAAADGGHRDPLRPDRGGVVHAGGGVGDLRAVAGDGLDAQARSCEGQELGQQRGARAEQARGDPRGGRRLGADVREVRVHPTSPSI
ncbi:hypothetical protein Ddc_20161 [Ditylenchus destructor]|nr:hypothetical protein Ddc_20161 [Ditylenchus destructor]